MLLIAAILTILLHVTHPALVDTLTIGAGELGHPITLHVRTLRLVTAVSAIILIVTSPVLGHTFTSVAPEVLFTYNPEASHCSEEKLEGRINNIFNTKY